MPRDERRRREASSRETAPARSWLAAPLSRWRRRGASRREATEGSLESRDGASAQLPRRAAVKTVTERRRGEASRRETVLAV